MMKVELADGVRLDNQGTIMHINADSASDVTIINHGCVMHADGCHIVNPNKTGDKQNTIHVEYVNRREKDLKRIEELEKECQRLRCQNETLRRNSQPADEDIHWGRKRIKEQKNEIDILTQKCNALRYEVKKRDEELAMAHEEIARLRGREVVFHLENENESLHSQLAVYERQTNDLLCQVADLQEQIAGTDRQQLLDTIDDLRDKLTRSENRERVLKLKADHAELNEWKARQQVWDEYRPTKEQVKAYYKVTLACMDSETEKYED